MEIISNSLRAGGHSIPLELTSSVEQLENAISAGGLEGAIVSIPPLLFRTDLQGDECCEYVRVINDALYQDCCRSTNKLRPLAYAPLQLPEIAAEIAAQLDEGWAGLIMGTEGTTASYAAEELTDLWDALNQRTIPLLIHPGSSSDPRLHQFYLTNLIGNATDITIAAASLIFSGVLSKYSELRIILAHGGGAVAALCGRWERALMLRRPGIPALDLPVKTAVRRLFVDTLCYSTEYLDLIGKIIGFDHVLLGTDWPFPMGTRAGQHGIEHLDEGLRQMIRATNARHVFGSRLETTRRMV
jgi:aminocarboxymuconate-semialdehyde decarboxylase